MRSTIITPRILRLAVVGGLTLLVAACSTSGGASSAPSVAASPAGPGSVTVGVATGKDGAYLTGPDGRTLYTFTPDTANTSTCVDTCATTWPPLAPGSEGTPKGANGVTGTFTTFARPDGSMQVAYNGSPLYYYAADTKAGDTTGQGIGGKWFIASPTGAGPGAAPSSGGGRYGY
jgi:predicted lipoprotein with Yx(FWY)xxD motif